MATISEAFALAVEHHQAGRLQLAGQMYRQILAAEPNHAESLHLLGVVAHQMGRHEAAVEHIARAIALNGTEAAFHNNLGEAYRALHRFPEALACYRRAVELRSDFAEAHSNSGIALQELGKLDEAVASYRRVLELKPNFAKAHNNLGAALKDQGKLEEAVACFRRAVQLNPDYAKAHNNLGDAFKDLGKLDEAVVSFRRALELRPDLAETHDNLGIVLQDLGKLDDAIACYRRALGLKPDYVEAHNNLGAALHIQGRLNEAIASYRRALKLRPGFAEAHNNLGYAFQEQGKLSDAVASYRRALESKPDYAEAHNNLGNALKDQGKPEDAVVCYRRALELKPDFAKAHSNLVYAMTFCPGYDARAICEEHRHWNQRHAAPLAKSILPHPNDRSPDRRLRVGYLSPDFRVHCQTFFTSPLFTAHDRRQFEIFCYADVVSPDKATARLRDCVDVWRNIVGRSDEQVAALVRDDRIDILVDLTMHMANNRVLVFARKPAPVQVCWLAYPGTTGLTAIDYRLTDPYLDPPGMDDAYYSEESVRLPDSFWCYDPLTSEPAVNPLPALERGQVTFGCLNNFCKVNAGVLKLWAAVLREVHCSRLMLLAPEGSSRQNVLDVLHEEGIAAERATFVAFHPRPQYLKLYHQIDLGLDTFPYNGHTTSLDAFWMGVPAVTLAGQTVVGRAGVCQLSNLGLPELIAREPQQFVRIAVELAGDLARLARLRATLRDRMHNSPLMDGPRFARNIEAAYRTMWQRWCAKG